MTQNVALSVEPMQSPCTRDPPGLNTHRICDEGHALRMKVAPKKSEHASQHAVSIEHIRGDNSVKPTEVLGRLVPVHLKDLHFESVFLGVSGRHLDRFFPEIRKDNVSPLQGGGQADRAEPTAEVEDPFAVQSRSLGQDLNQRTCAGPQIRPVGIPAGLDAVSRHLVELRDLLDVQF